MATHTNSDATKDFLQKVIETHSSGHAREHSYRPALKELFEKIIGLTVINEPKRSEYGAPDFVFLKGKTVIAYAEAKDINISLTDIEKSEQMDRYYGYSNIILTNGIEFRFYRNAARYEEPIVIAKLHKDHIEPIESAFQLLEDTISDFIKESREPIKSGSVLAKVMAGKARRIRDNVKMFLADEHSTRNEDLLSVYEAIKKLLLADLDKPKFADMYAQTLVYGLFVARYYDHTPDNFSRQEARDLVPASNPFLRHFFDHIAGPSFDARIEIIVNELCEEFTHADVQAIVHNYYKVDKDDSSTGSGQGKVYINAKQYFGGVPETAWTFYIGGYQPSQKWLKDRVGRTLSNTDIEHYQKMIVALSETARIMEEIDGVK